MKPEVIVNVGSFFVPKHRIEEIYSDATLRELWEKIISHKNWKKIHSVPKEWEETKKKMTEKLSLELKAKIVSYAIQRTVVECTNPNLYVAIASEMEEYISTLDSLTAKEIEQSNDGFKAILQEQIFCENIAKAIFESLMSDT